jgi:hypothetical protein
VFTQWNGDHNEDWCRSLPLYNIEEDGCNGFATFHSYDTLTSEVVYKFWDADQVAKAVKSIRDPGYALKNAVDCKNAGGGDASYPAPNFGALTPEYPPCFFNIQSE